MRAPVRFELGNYRFTILDAGRFALDGGAMFGVVPRTLWQKLFPVDEHHRIPLALNCLLIEYKDEKLLFETGIGTKFEPKFTEMYGIEDYPQHERQTPIETALESIGLQAADITTVMFSHLHFDHAGGATKKQPDGTIIPTFSNAKYLVHEGEWNSAECPHERCRASYLKENFIPLKDSGQLTLLSNDVNELLPNLTLRVTGGHTKFHQVLVLEQSNGGMIYWGDLIPTHHHLKIPFVMGYDEYPMDTMAVKKTLLKEACDNGWINVFDHDIDMPACTLEATEKPDDYRPYAFSGESLNASKAIIS